jgi:hypothetical protein
MALLLLLQAQARSDNRLAHGRTCRNTACPQPRGQARQIMIMIQVHKTFVRGARHEAGSVDFHNFHGSAQVCTSVGARPSSGRCQKDIGMATTQQTPDRGFMQSWLPYIASYSCDFPITLASSIDRESLASKATKALRLAQLFVSI